MIHGSTKQVCIIAAKVLPGYGSFVNEDYEKSFIYGEPLVVYYPPDHANAGQKYSFTRLEQDSSSAANINIMGIFSGEGERTYRLDSENIHEYHYDFYIMPFYTPNQDVHPANNNDGVDSFLIKGSIIQGLNSGAKRFYDGPFKAFTVESEKGCTYSGSDIVPNLLDGSTCKGDLKGSYYESGYSSGRHDVFVLVGNTKNVVNPKSVFNESMMKDTPFSVNMTWFPVKNRRERPIPYRMNGVSSVGNFAVLISKKHVLIPSDREYGYTMKFYSESQGLLKRTISDTTTSIGPNTTDPETRDFANMWAELGFRDPQSSQELFFVYNQLKEHFKNCLIGTLDSELPNDVVPVHLYDEEGSSQIRWGGIIGSENRFHLAHNCDSLNSNEWTFTPYMRCFGDKQTSLPPNCSINDIGLLMTTTDIGAPLFTYYRGDPVLLGMLSNPTSNLGRLEYFDGAVTATNPPPNSNGFTTTTVMYQSSGYSSTGTFSTGSKIGSSKIYSLPWGRTITPIQFLNLWLAKEGSDCVAISKKLTRGEKETIYTFPAP